MAYSSDIPALRKTNVDGVAYHRPPSIETLLVKSHEWSLEELSRRARITDRRDPEYLPSEVVIHHLRATRGHNDDRQFNALYPEIRRRFLASFPVSQLSKGDRVVEIGEIEALRDQAWDRFVEQIVRDREQYNDRLDYFEVRFDHAVKLKRHSAFRTYYSHDKPTEPIDAYDAGDVDPAIEEAMARVRSAVLSDEDDMTFRFDVRRAIDLLPDHERRVIEMELAGFPDDSKDPDVLSISGVLQCTAKTVYNRRRSALNKIRQTLNLETEDDD